MTLSTSWGQERQTFRPEDSDLLRGAACFVADLNVDGVLEAHFVRSVDAHGRLLNVETARASAVEGVVAAFSAGDLPALPPTPATPRSEPRPGMERPSLAVDHVRFAGEAIAVVLARDRYAAEDGGELVSVAIDPLPVVATIDESLAQDAPRLFGKAGNVASVNRYGAPVGDIIRAAPYVIERTFHYPRVAPTSLEGRAILALPDDGGVTIWCSHQAPHRLRDAIRATLGIEDDKVRVRVPAIGGAFGAKSQTFPEYIVIAYLARHLGAPIRWTEDRSEALTSGTHGRAQRHHVRVAADDHGRLMALEASIDADVGAYPHTGALVPNMTAWVMSGPYRIPSIYVVARAVVTNATPTAPYRGAGRPEAAFTLERSLDALAARVGLDPAQVRMRNLLDSSDFPYKSPTGAVYDSGNYARALQVALKTAEYEKWKKQKQAARRDSASTALIGLGVACYVERAGGAVGSSEYGSVQLLEDGRIEVLSGAMSQGQGHRRLFGRLVARILQVDATSVEVIQGDTRRVPRGTGTFASRSAQVGGAALYEASTRALAIARSRAAALLETSEDDLEYGDGSFRVRGAPSTSVTLSDVVRSEGPIKAEVDVAPPQAFPFGSYVAVVEVDSTTGIVSIRRLVAVEDCGTVLEPLIVQGQALGSITQGIGQALYEEVPYSESGQPLASTLGDYLLPTSADLPSIALAKTTTPNPNVPHGVKGAGESGCIGAPPAIANAVMDALKADEEIPMPLTAAKVFAALRARRSSLEPG